MRNNNKFAMIKLPSGAFYLHSLNDGLDARAFLFASKGIKSKGTTVVITISLISHYNYGSIREYLVNKGFTKVDRVFVLYDRQNLWGFGIRDIRDIQKILGRTLKDITKRILTYDMTIWLNQEGYTDRHLQWYGRVLDAMASDKRFILGQIGDRLRLADDKEKLVEYQILLEKKQEELKNLRSPEEIQTTSIKNLKNMKWIDKIEAGPGNSLRILTKPMACTFVPNIGRYVAIDYIARNDILYRIMKYQCLGKYFIIQPDYYIIDSRFGIKGDSNTRYKQTAVRQVMINNLYFKGQACHIGNGQACVGELGAAIGQASKTGLDMLLMSFEAYLRSINLPDAAGQRYYVLPMGDADGNVEVWPYVEDIMKRLNVPFPAGAERNLDTYEKILHEPEMRRNNYAWGKNFDGDCRSFSDAQAEDNMQKCLKLIEEREPQVYEEIMKRVAEGAVI